nr:hypothetical protein BgiMline_021880 [Biomphalaria glabrata]
MSMARYAIDIVVPEDDQPLEIMSGRHKGSNFNENNPLGISDHLRCFVTIYLPWLVAITLGLNVFGIWVLKSSFLRGLVLQPMFKLYLELHCLLMITGPFYVWMGQTFHQFVQHVQVYPCFLLLWAHNFAMIATSSMLVAMIIERAISIGRPEIVWDIWRRACRNISYLLVLTSLVFSVSGVLCVDIESLIQGDTHYPICMPWWDNELGADVTWYKIVAMSFATLPCIAVVLSLILLLTRERRFKAAMRKGVSALNHYNAMYVEIKATLHFKFVRSFVWLSLAFLFATSPIGLFIVFGPYLQITFDKIYPEPLPQKMNVTWELDDDLENDTKTSTTAESPVVRTYSSISRSDVETCLWLVYYTYSLCVVPILLKTEVLFWREWCGRARKVSNLIYCRKVLSPKWRTISGLKEELSQGHLVGPYIPSEDALNEPSTIQKELQVVQVTRMEVPEAVVKDVQTKATSTVSTPQKIRAKSSDEGRKVKNSRAARKKKLKRAKDSLEITTQASKKNNLKSEDTSSI